jgi:ABC-2 type transport system permease protein
VGDLGVCALFGVAAVLVGLALGRDSVTGQRDSIAG